MAKELHYSKQQVALRTSDLVCIPCGKTFLTEKQKKEREKDPCMITANKGYCGLCKKETSVVHCRNFNWLNQSFDK